MPPKTLLVSIHNRSPRGAHRDGSHAIPASIPGQRDGHPSRYMHISRSTALPVPQAPTSSHLHSNYSTSFHHISLPRRSALRQYGYPNLRPAARGAVHRNCLYCAIVTPCTLRLPLSGGEIPAFFHAVRSPQRAVPPRGTPPHATVLSQLFTGKDAHEQH